MTIIDQSFFEHQNMPTIIVNVEYKSKSIFGWEGLPVGEDMNIKEFYENLVMPEIKENYGIRIL